MSFSPNASIIHLLHRVSQHATEAFAQSIGDRDVTVRQLVVLSAIADNEGASQTRLCELTGVDRSTLADIARRLTKKGLIARRRTKQDARAYAVKTTEQGARLLREVLPVFAEVEANVTGVLSVKLRADLAYALERLLENAYHSSLTPTSSSLRQPTSHRR